MDLVYPSPPPPQKKKLRITIVFDFSWDDCNTQDLETMVRQNSGGGGIYKNKVHYSVCESMNKLNRVLSFFTENKVANGA